MDSPVLAVILLLAAVALFLTAQWVRVLTGVPGGEIVYDDSGAAEKQSALYSARYRLTGRPDYLVQRGRAIVPVEIKSGRSPEIPYESHIFQLIAYCLLVEEEYGFPPPYGIIRYTDRAFEVDYTPEMKRALLLVMEDMRAQIDVDDVPRSHDEPHRCHVCGYRTVCAERLVK